MIPETDVAQGLAEGPEPRRRAIAILIGLAIVALPLALTILHIQSYRALSPYDEGGHVDYLLRVLRWETLAPGDRLLQESMRLTACRGIAVAEISLPPCRPGQFRPDDFPANGYNYLHHHPPFYYFLTGLLVRPLMLTGLDVVDAARLTDALWVGLGLMVVWLVVRRLGLRSSEGAIAVMLFGLTPAVIHISATVNNDATTFLAGASLLLLAMKWEEEPGWLAALPLVAAIAVLLKGTNLVAVIAVALYLAARALSPVQRRDRRRMLTYVVPIGAMCASAVIALTAWVALRPEAQAGFRDPALDALRADSLSVGKVLVRTHDLILPTGSITVPGFSGEEVVALLVQLSTLVVIAATLGSAFYLGSSDRAATIGIAGFLSLPLSAIVLTLANYLALGVYISLPDRYGLGAVPLLAVGVARGLRQRAPRWTTAALVAGLGTAVLWAMLTRG